MHTATQRRRRVSPLPGHSGSQLFVDWRRVRAAFFRRTAAAVTGRRIAQAQLHERVT